MIVKKVYVTRVIIIIITVIVYIFHEYLYIEMIVDTKFYCYEKTIEIFFRFYINIYLELSVHSRSSIQYLNL